MVKWKALGLVRALGAEDSAAWLCGRSAYLLVARHAKTVLVRFRKCFIRKLAGHFRKVSSRI